MEAQDRRLSFDELERDHPEAYAGWVRDLIERGRRSDHVVLRGDGRLDLTTDEGCHWEDYWTWDMVKWREQELEEIRGEIPEEEESSAPLGPCGVCEGCQKVLGLSGSGRLEDIACANGWKGRDAEKQS